MKMNTLFACLGITGAVKLFKMYFAVDISENFVKCADTQLSKLYEQRTLLKIDNRTWIGTAEKEDLFYKKDQISQLPFQLYLPNVGGSKITICWQSKSGLIYDIADANIDCNDIEFWFENLDVELCRNANNPKWSLIPAIRQQRRIDMIEQQCGILLSASFLSCADNQLSLLFTKKTGIKITKKISLSLLNSNKPYYTSGNVSSINTSLVISDNWNFLDIYWKSKSGKIYLPEDRDIDCNDIEFWFDNFDAELYIKQYYPNQKLPFKIKDISYELVVTRINLDCTISMKLKPGAVNEADKIVEEINDFIAAFNDKSEKRDRGEGVIHNWNTEIKDDKVIYNLDLGSTGVSFFKKILTYLSKMNVFQRVEIE